ncbi:MAG: DUF2334 domain-containing protein [Clostridium sp.]
MRRIIILFSLVIIVYLGGDLLISSKTLPLINPKLLSNFQNTEGGKFLSSIKDQSITNPNPSLFSPVPYDVNFYLKKTKLNFKNKVLHRYNRYYLPLSEVSNLFGNSIVVGDDEVQLSNDVTINISDKNYTLNDKTLSLHGDIFKVNNEPYISFFDACEIYNLSTYWDYKTNSIYINTNKGKNHNTDKKDKKKSKKDAYIRFEDVSAGDVYAKQDNLEKLRIITDYMDDENQKFSLGWIPRYINKPLNIDNDISRDNTFSNANFLFTMDYLENRGGSIGIHGYTHQYGDVNSITGIEFGDDGFNDPSEVRKRLESAINIATKVNIPYAFWETPHYHATAKQQAIFEEYFKVIYEPSFSKYNKKITTSDKNGITKYIPAPLSNVKNNDVGPMIQSIKNKPSDVEMSLFYHPSIEIESVHVSLGDDGTINSSYDDNSILKQIVSCVDSLDYSFKSVIKTR